MSVFPSRDHSSALEAPKQLELGRAPQHGTTAARDVPSAACGRDGGVWGTFGALELGGAGARVEMLRDGRQRYGCCCRLPEQPAGPSTAAQSEAKWI